MEYLLRSVNMWFLLTFLCGVAVAQSKDKATSTSFPESQRLERLETLADIWGKVWLFHPAIVTEEIDWDAVLVDAIPRVEEAQTTEELAQALQQILLPLNDPTLWIQSRTEQLLQERSDLQHRRIGEEIGYIDARNPLIFKSKTFIDDFYHQVAELGEVEYLIVDLRFEFSAEEALDSSRFRVATDEWMRVFLTQMVRAGPFIRRLNQGLTGNEPWNPTYQYWEVGMDWSERGRGSHTLKPIASGGDLLARYYPDTEFGKLQPIATKTVFLTNHQCFLIHQKTFDALQQLDHVTVVLERTGSFVNWYARQPGRVRNVYSYPKGLDFHFEAGRLLSPLRGLGAQPDLILSDRFEMVDLPELMTRIQRLKKRSQVAPIGFDFQMRFPRNEPPSDRELSRQERLLGLIKIWTAVRYLSPHLEFFKGNWENVLTAWIPRIEASKSLEEYYVELERLGSKLNDCHVVVWHELVHKPSWRLFSPPFRLARIEGKPVVVGVRESEVATDLPRVGDVLISVDGTMVESLETQWKERVSASTDQALYRDIYSRMLSGEEGSSISASLLSDGEIRKIQAVRTVDDWDQETALEPFELLPSGFGLLNLNLDGLSSIELLDRSYEELRDAPGWILDMRGYPNDRVRRSLIGILAREQSPPGLLERRVPTPDLDSVRWLRFRATPWTKDKERHYGGPVVVLINERAQSRAEDFCIALESMGRVTFVGSGTAGTNGEGYPVFLPGGGFFSFTSIRSLYADGTPFQNIGIVPDIVVRPTIEGIRQGRDEVLEKGIDVLAEQLQSERSESR